MTCFKSGLTLAVLINCLPLVFYYTGSILITGIGVIMLGAYLYNMPICRAGLNAVATRMSSYSNFARMLFILISLAVSVAVYITLSLQFTFLQDSYDTARLMIAITLISFLPWTLFIITKTLRD